MKRILFATVATLSLTLGAAPKKIDPAILEWFPKQVREAEPTEAKRFDIAPGVEYGYVFCQKLFCHPGDIHVVKVDLQTAKIRPFIEEGAFREKGDRFLRTTDAAEKTQALFSLNGGFFCWKDDPEKNLEGEIPYYRMKINGQMVKSIAGGTWGIAFMTNGWSKIKVGEVKDDELPQWDCFMAGEAVLTSAKTEEDLKKREIKPKDKPEAPRTCVGMDPTGRYLYCFVTGGRRTGNMKSWGLTYWDVADVMAWFGCSAGINMDGGGSTTLAVRKDALIKSKAKKPYTPESRQATDNYFILNATSDGRERAVLDHIQFWDEKSAAYAAKVAKNPPKAKKPAKGAKNAKNDKKAKK